MKITFRKNRLFITGGASELAVEIAKEALLLNFFITLSVRSEENREKLNLIFKQSIKEKKISIVFLDLNDISQIEKINWHNQNYLIDIAHPHYESLLASSNSNDLIKYINASFLGHSILLKQASRGMLANKFGRLIYISSTATEKINPGQGFYAATKSGIEKLYQTIGIEMGGKGITTAILRPGYINCGRGKRYIKDSNISKLIPTKKPLESNDIAKTVLFLLSDSALQLNSSIITMDGGMSATK